MKKAINYIYIVFFLLCITLPFVLSDKEGGKISEGENRYLATAPDYFENGHLKLGGLREGTEEWINDNAYGREYFLKITDYINVHILGEKKNGVYYYGENNWIFLNQDWVINNYSNANALNDEEIRLLVEKYTGIQEYYKEKGIGVCTSVFPYKTDIYGEYFTNSVIKVNDESLLDIFINNLEQNESFNVDVPYDELMSYKNTDIQTYYASYDASHWNYYGAYIGYLSVMNNVKKDIPGLKILSEEDFYIEEVQVENEYAGKTYSDIDYSFTLKEGSHASLDMTFFESINYQSQDTWQSYRYYKNEDQTLPKAIIVGDSYVWMFMLPWISESFSELVFIHQLDVDNLDEMVSIINPDEIIYAGLTDTVYQSIMDTDY